MNRILYPIIFVIAGSLFACTHIKKPECTQVRAAFDIGSGTTKLKVAEVNVCNKEITKVLLEENRKVSFKEELSKNSGKLPKRIITKGVAAIAELKSLAEKHSPLKYKAVTTSAIRKASNGADFVRQVTSETGVPVKIISQQEEAELGFIAAVTASKVSEDDLVVWDIGGGSMQLAAKSEDKFVTALGTLASVGFKNFIVESLQKKKSSARKSPNPIGIKNAKKALEFAQKFSTEKTPDVIKNKLKQPNTKVVGIGGVHYYSIRGQLKAEKGTPYTLSELEKATKKRALFTDKQIGGDYASTDVSNLILVEGFMRGLGINKVLPLKVNLTDALLVTN